MLWHTKSELQEEGPPTRKDMFWATLAIPLLIFQIVSWSSRIIGGFQGKPLKISSFFEIDVSASDPTWQFAAAVTMYFVFIAFAILILYGCTLQFQRWLFWQNRF